MSSELHNSRILFVP